MSKMNRPSLTDEPQAGDGCNWSPPQFSNHLTTNQDFNGVSNTTAVRRDGRPAMTDVGEVEPPGPFPPEVSDKAGPGAAAVAEEQPPAATNVSADEARQAGIFGPHPGGQDEHPVAAAGGPNGDETSPSTSWLSRAKHAIVTFAKFIGPGFMVAVAYSMLHVQSSRVLSD
jgi:metal iron transporter